MFSTPSNIGILTSGGECATEKDASIARDEQVARRRRVRRTVLDRRRGRCENLRGEKAHRGTREYSSWNHSIGVRREEARRSRQDVGAVGRAVLEREIRVVAAHDFTVSAPRGEREGAL